MFSLTFSEVRASWGRCVWWNRGRACGACRCLDVRTSVSGDWGIGRGCGQRTKKVCAAQKRSELRPGGLFVVVSVRVRAEYIYTLSISRPRPHVILLHTPDAETPARRHTPRGRIPHPTCTQSRYHANGALHTRTTASGVTPWRHRQ